MLTTFTRHYGWIPANCYIDALSHRSLNYQRVPQSLHQMKAVLASGSPIVFGFSVYESFESTEVASTGIVPMPQMSESPIGGHCCLIVGYQENEQRFTIRNSWGIWGDKGYCYMPYAYLLSSSLSSDFWTIRTVV